MRKLITGLLASLTIVFTMSSLASAQESPNEDPTQQLPVQCTMNIVEPNFANEDGTYDSGTPISLELYVPKGGPMDWFFVASFNGGEEYRLNDESLTAIGWTPIDPGTYTVRGEFIDENGNVLPVEDPAACMVILTVVAVQVQPEPPAPEPTVPAPTGPVCGPPETLTLVPNPGGWIDTYNEKGELCAQSGDKPETEPRVIVPSSSQGQLPHTGSGTTTTAITGFGLVFFGVLLKLIARRRLASIA